MIRRAARTRFGSSIDASCCVARNICRSPVIACSRAITELGRQTPNLYIEDQGSTNAVSLRGLGSPAEGLESPVGFYLDGIAVSRALGLLSMPFFDLERVEVLRGPQSTFFGRNTSAGAINVISAKPGEETEGRVRVRAGNRQMREYEGALSGPITDSISGRLALVSTERGAYLDNPLGQDAGGDDKFGARGQLAFTPKPISSGAPRSCKLEGS